MGILGDSLYLLTSNGKMLKVFARNLHLNGNRLNESKLTLDRVPFPLPSKWVRRISKPEEFMFFVVLFRDKPALGLLHPPPNLTEHACLRLLDMSRWTRGNTLLHQAIHN